MNRARSRCRPAVLALVALVLTGCTDDPAPVAPPPPPPASTPSAAASPGADAVSVLHAAVAGTNRTTSTFTTSADLGTAGSTTGAGASDPAAKASRYHTELTTQGQKVTVDSVLIGTDLFLKAPGVTEGDTWGHADTTRVRSLAKLGLDANGSATNLDVFDKTLAGAAQTGPGAFRGTLDGTKNPALTATTGGDALKSMPFEAQIDAEGRLVSLTTHAPALGATPATTSIVRFADFGRPVTVTRPPAAQVKEMPDSFYAAMQ